MSAHMTSDGRVALLCNTPICGARVDAETLARARDAAGVAGWGNEGRVDRCPEHREDRDA